MEIRPEGTEFFYVGGRTEGSTGRYDEGNNCFRNFANAPNELPVDQNKASVGQTTCKSG